MKKDIAMRLVAALRSGDYVQGPARLRWDDDRFCCLGVLCNLHAIDHPEIAAAQTRRDRYMDADVVLPLAVRDWAGMHSVGGAMKRPKGEPNKMSLANMNDRLWSFDWIADHIETNWEHL